MNRLLLLLVCMLTLSPVRAEGDCLVVGAERLDAYLPLLEGKRVGVLTNHTARVGDTHLVDTLLALGIELRRVFAPEHGFRGEASAGEKVESYRDAKTGLPITSLYGAQKRPRREHIEALDVVIFDMQDVGLRYYTYLSSLHYLMEACAESQVAVVVLDRPNPNGFYVDGPILEPHHQSFVGMHPIPTVHGMTLGELAQMINGQEWLGPGVHCPLTVITCLGYTHQTRYTLPVKPSPNLPNMRSIYLYPSLCFLEGTPVSLGRGTDFPFQVYGHPKLRGANLNAATPPFTFTPGPTPGSKNPPLKGVLCQGIDLRTEPTNEALWQQGVDLRYVVDCYRQLGGGDAFFKPIFKLLTGVDYIQQMIIAGASAQEIEARWSEDIVRFKALRKPYLLYEE